MCSESRLDSPSFIPETIYSMAKKPAIIIHALVLSVRYPNMGLLRHFSLLIHFAPMNLTESLIASQNLANMACSLGGVSTLRRSLRGRLDPALAMCVKHLSTVF